MPAPLLEAVKEKGEKVIWFEMKESRRGIERLGSKTSNGRKSKTKEWKITGVHIKPTAIISFDFNITNQITLSSGKERYVAQQIMMLVLIEAVHIKRLAFNALMWSLIKLKWFISPISVAMLASYLVMNVISSFYLPSKDTKSFHCLSSSEILGFSVSVTEKPFHELYLYKMADVERWQNISY